MAEVNRSGEESAGDLPDMDQNLIDSILGFSKGEHADDTVGPRALLHTTAVPHERVPMLEAAFERLVRSLKSSMRKLASDNVEVTLCEMTSSRFGPYLTSIALPAMLAIVKTDPWGGLCIVSVSAGLVYSLVELVLGGSTAGQNAQIEGRGFTSIEMRIARLLFDAILTNMEEAFSTITPVTFSIEHFETSPRFAAIAPPASLTALAKFRIEMGGVSGDFEIAIPYSTLEPVRDLLLTNYSGDKLGNDEIWGTHLAAQAAVSETMLSAILYEGKMPLGKILNLGVGDTLMFTTKPDDFIDLRCENVVLARGRLGRVDHNIAVRVETLQGMAP
ncbi:MAG TPA: FliM/FliN family flagellar motor switch protein [Enterovirga sp.]|jgi:flagellar motor switch protein FliM|nr:FliM/FliN family flagellar motor switch protein [Enterovirga sp.]